MKFDYYLPTRLLFGAGKLKELHKHKLPGAKALIVMTGGKSLRANGYLAALEEELRLAGAGFVIYDKITPNPEKAQVMEGARIAKSNGCDFVVGFGGGSSIDAAKAIAVMATNHGDYWDYVSGGSGKGQPVPNDPLPIVAITTTAGTGTEADPWMVVTKEETNEKIGFGYDKTFPVLSVVDPELMLTVPSSLTAYQGFDALFHSTEGYLNTIAYPISDAFALRAISLVSQSLPTAVKDGGNLAARTDVALANTLSGMVESTSGCISEHSLAHAMGAMKPQLAHGAALIMISRAYYETFANKGCADARMIDMARAMGKHDAKRAMDFVDALYELQVACGVDALKMSDYGILYEDLSKYVDNAFDTMGALFQFDPCVLSKEDCLKIYQASYR
ncbi:MAG: iron-containing alcohol dehydrogenase [Eubacteriales bacterium]|jgi:alcohol dehydrogenase|nr:iron-containing alcohol dehydrogenase [Eubacteriales bacterium]